VLAALLGIRVAESMTASLDFPHDATIVKAKTQETAMAPLRQGLLIPLLLVSFVSVASAGDRMRDDGQPPLTGKERLGRKWTDEQRIDNCKVPTDKHGTKPRPSVCRGAPSS
jgi:hypothetical protein